MFPIITLTSWSGEKTTKHRVWGWEN